MRKHPYVFKDRLPLNRRNDGRQTLPLSGGVPGTRCERFEPGREWDLGDHADPDRGFMRATQLAAGETLPAASFGDWRFVMVLEGEVRVAGRALSKDGCLTIRPNSPVGEITAGRAGAQLLELARTARGKDRRPAA